MSSNETQTSENASEESTTTETVQLDGTADAPVQYNRYEGAQTRRRSAPVVNDWLEGEYPENNRASAANGTIYRGQHKAIQNPDGTGEVRWQRATMGIRTINGLIIRNSDFGGISINKRNGVTSRRVERCDVDYEFASLPLDFIRGVANHQGYSARRSTNEMHPMRIVDVQSDDGGSLITYKNGNQLFYGHDTTAHGSGRFGFVIDEAAPVPEPERALDLLLPHDVRQAQADGAEIPRQGEWFFVPEEYATEERNGSLQKPGVAERPYGASPLDSHVPRDWASVNADEEVIANFREHDDIAFTGSYDLDEVLESPQHVVAFYATGRMHFRSSLTWSQLRDEVLGGVWLRGTVRHDDRDHYVENLGDKWHLAVTHDYEVVTQDDVGSVRVD